MKKIELTEEQVREAFTKAQSDEVKETLTALFPDIAKELTKKKPTLDDYTSITSYEDACEALGIRPSLESEEFQLWDTKKGCYVCKVPKHIIALMKLEVISRALWGRNWQPKPDAEGSKVYYYPWFFLYTKKEIERMTVQQTGALLSANASHGANAGFGSLDAGNRSSYSRAHIGFRLCQETDEKAKYFGSRIFVKLWADYLRFNFTTGDFLIDE